MCHAGCCSSLNPVIVDLLFSYILYYVSSKSHAIKTRPWLPSEVALRNYILLIFCSILACTLIYPACWYYTVGTLYCFVFNNFFVLLQFYNFYAWCFSDCATRKLQSPADKLITAKLQYCSTCPIYKSTKLNVLQLASCRANAL